MRTTATADRTAEARDYEGQEYEADMWDFTDREELAPEWMTCDADGNQPEMW